MWRNMVPLAKYGSLLCRNGGNDEMCNDNSINLRKARVTSLSSSVSFKCASLVKYACQIRSLNLYSCFQRHDKDKIFATDSPKSKCPNSNLGHKWTFSEIFRWKGFHSFITLSDQCVQRQWEWVCVCSTLYWTGGSCPLCQSNPASDANTDLHQLENSHQV